MPAGLLEVDGSIDLAQFWPVGSSDAESATYDAIRNGKITAAPGH